MSELVLSVKGWRTMLFDLKGWLLAIIIFSICFTYYKSFDSPVSVISTNVESNTTFVGSYYKLCREVKYERDTSLTIDRAFIKNTTSGDIYTLSLAPLTITRREGLYNVCRYIYIPDKIELGSWTIKTYATYNYFIFKHTIEIEDIPIEIKG